MLGPDDVHVWRVPLIAPPAHVPRLVMALDADERARAVRFRMRRDRDRFVIAHAALRAILGGCLGLDAARVRFGVGPGGKPKLREPGEEMSFSLSHSDGLALVAVARGREVGVDVERVRGDLADGRIAGRFFAPSDAAALDALPATERTAGFFLLWTCAEAFVKARGAASIDDRFRMPPLELPRLPASLGTGSPRTIAGWTIAPLLPGDGYAGAIAVEGTGGQLRCWEWTPDTWPRRRSTRTLAPPGPPRLPLLPYVTADPG